MALALFVAEASVAQSQPAPPPPLSTIQPTPPDQPPAARDVGQPRPEADDGVGFSDQLVVLAALLVAVGAFLAIAFAVQVFYLGLGLRAMRRASQKAERNTIAMQRAFVHVSDMTWRADSANVSVSPLWFNSGATPTRRLRISTNWKASHGELRPDFDNNYVQPPENLFLGPHAKMAFGTMLVPMRDIQAAIEERMEIYVWGRATYEDVFEGTKPHFFEFCHRLEITGDAPGKIMIRFAQFGRSNGSDEDERPLAEA